MTEWQPTGHLIAGLPILKNGNRRRVVNEKGEVILDYEMEVKIWK